jgi:hypothetical protein
MSISYLQKEREEGWREQGRGRHGETWGGRERERERVREGVYKYKPLIDLRVSPPPTDY